MRFTRSCGILLHPTSLPGRYGIGDLGQSAYQFVDYLATSKQSLWQILPLGPTGYGDSPYQCFSAFAGNPLLISPDMMIEAGYLPADVVALVPPFPTHKVDYGWVIDYKNKLFDKAFAHFQQKGTAVQKAAFTGSSRRRRNAPADLMLSITVEDVCAACDTILRREAWRAA